MFMLLMRLPPRATRTATPFPCSTLFRFGRGVDAEYFAGTERRGLYAPTADVAEQVQYALTFGIRRQACAVHAVVVEPAGFLACHDRSSEEHTSELQSLMRNSYAVFCLQKKKLYNNTSASNLKTPTT